MKINLPRISQILFFIAFLALFVTTDYRGKDEISVALNSFFRSDPLVAVSYLLSAKTFTLLLLPGLLLLLFSAILGRFFCGWICPLGTIIERNQVNPLKELLPYLRFSLLEYAVIPVDVLFFPQLLQMEHTRSGYLSDKQTCDAHFYLSH